MFNKMTIQERYYIFVSLCLVGMVGYQSYHTYRTDVITNEALNKNNKQTQRYSEVVRQISLENLGLQHDLLHAQAMHEASTNHCHMLQKEINAISEYWEKEYIKVSDELFDLKNSNKKTMKKSGGQIWKEGQAKVKKNMSNKGHSGVTGEAGISCKAKVVEKEWGREIWMVNNLIEDYCGKILQINQGYNTSLHFHMEKHETFYITKGQLQVDTICTMNGVKMTRILNEGHVLEIDRGQPHQLIAYDGDVEFIEISTFHEDSDSKRINS